MARESLAPLLRGIGSSIILAGVMMGYFVARQDAQVSRLREQGPGGVAMSEKGSPEVSAGSENGNGGTSDESVAERVVGSRWFEWLGFVGAGVVSSSFYVEYLSRRKRSA